MKTTIRYLFLVFLVCVSLSSRAQDSCVLNPRNTGNPNITIQDVLGTYRRLPVGNNFHVGTITKKGGTDNTLVWKNQAGVSWEVTPDFANNRLLTGAGNPYQSNPGGTNFSLQFQSGLLIGFKFLGELYSLDGALADVFDPGTGQLTVNKLTVGATSYCNRVVTVDKVISVGTAPAIGVSDTFDPTTGQLTMPAVKVGGVVYNNVVVTIGTVISSEVLPRYDFGSFGGYVTLLAQDPPSDFRYGFSTYTSIQKVSDYQIQGMQFGWGTWFMPDNRATKIVCPESTTIRRLFPDWPDNNNHFQTIEGGPGQWGSTRFPSNITKFRANSVPDCYNNEYALPGYGFHGNPTTTAVLGMAQLSNQLLLAPDGLTFNLGTQASALFGYGYIALPFIPANGLTGTQAVGNQSWTLFVNSSNFKGPVAFYVPKLYTQIVALDAALAGKTMDVTPAYNNALSLEIGSAPAYTSTDTSGVTYRRIAKMSFPVTASPTLATLTQDFKRYSKQALWNSFSDGMQTGTLPSEIDVGGSYNVGFTSDGFRGEMRDTKESVQINNWVDSNVSVNQGNGTVFSLSWQDPKNAGTLPEYFRKDGKVWTPVAASLVPSSTGLAKQTFPALAPSDVPSLDTSSSSRWTSSKWAAGPFTTNLNDGSTVTYVWYKFIDQPAIAQLGLDAETLQRLQSLVEKIHFQYAANGPTWAPPSSGNLVSMDNALLVPPPPNLSVGYVPIAIGQKMQASTSSLTRQTVTFDESVKSIDMGATGSVHAITTSGLAISYSSLTSKTCTIDGTTVTGLMPGPCVIVANQAGNSNYNAAAQVTRTLLIAPQSLEIEFESGWNLVGNSGSMPISVAATLGDASKALSVWKWVHSGNSASTSYPGWAFYSPNQTDGGESFAANKGYDFLATINPGEGFWVNAAAPFSATLQSDLATQSSDYIPSLVPTPGGKRALPSGWSLIATGDSPTPAQFNAAISTSKTSPSSPMHLFEAPLNLTSMWAWNAKKQAWYMWAPSLINNGTLSSYLNGNGFLDFTTIVATPTGTVLPMNGVWVNMP